MKRKRTKQRITPTHHFGHLVIPPRVRIVDIAIVDGDETVEYIEDKDAEKRKEQTNASRENNA